MRSRSESRALELEAVLKEAGLGGRVRVGIPLPIDTPAPAPPPEAVGPEAPATPLPLGGDGRGELLELTGGPSSGRTALALRLAAAVTARGELAGWVDLPDALDPRSLRRAGAELRALLWVRPPGLRAGLRAAELLVRAGFALVVLDVSGVAPAELARLGPAVWTRLARRVRQCRTTLVLLGSERVAGAFATRALHTERCQARFEDGLLEGLDVRATVVRDREGPIGAAYGVRVFHRPQ